MSDSPNSLDAPAEVLKHLAGVLGTDQLTITAASHARLPSGVMATAYTAAVADRPNATARVVMDETGELSTVEEADALVGRSLFAPVFTPGFTATPTPHDPVTIDPTTNDWRLSKCERITETITVTVPPSGAVPKADVYLLADTTLSMAGVIEAVRVGASSILNHPGLVGFDVAWGVGNYRDFPVGTGLNSYAFAHQLSPTTNHVAADAAIGAWSAGEGSDLPEGQLNALHQLATDPAIGWRTDSKRIVVWFGDAPGHDPICTSLTGFAAAITEASATADLVAAAITVVAVSTDTGVAGALDADPNATSTDYGTCTPAGAAGQATRITTATGGSHTTGVNPDTVATTLADLIAAAVTSTGNVSLVPTGDSAQFVESITPAGGYGPLAGDVEHVLTFEVVWVGVKPCGDRDHEYLGTIDVIADGVVVAQKRVRVTVPACRYHYTVEFVCGTEPDERSDDTGHDHSGKDDCHTVVPGYYATAVTIYNPGTCPARIEKRFAPLVLHGKTVGREPEVVDAKRFARLLLGPYQATMDDCCALEEAVGDGEGLVVGVLDIVSDVPLSVSAIHTASAGPGKAAGPSITTRAVEAHRAP